MILIISYSVHIPSINVKQNGEKSNPKFLIHSDKIYQ